MIQQIRKSPFCFQKNFGKSEICAAVFKNLIFSCKNAEKRLERRKKKRNEREMKEKTKEKEKVAQREREI